MSCFPLPFLSHFTLPLCKDKQRFSTQTPKLSLQMKTLVKKGMLGNYFFSLTWIVEEITISVRTVVFFFGEKMVNFLFELILIKRYVL